MIAVGWIPLGILTSFGANKETIFANARDGFSVRIIALEAAFTSMDVIIADALVCPIRGRYLELAIKVRSPSCASLMPQIPVTIMFSSPIISPSIMLAISFKVFCIDSALIFYYIYRLISL